MRWGYRLVVPGVVLPLMAACGFSPTAPFSGFDGDGSRITGTFDSPAQGQEVGSASSAASPAGIRVSVRERPSLSVTVGGDGTFALVGIPSGSVTLLFDRDGRRLGEIRIQEVRRNQGILIVVALITDDEVVLIDERRDAVSFEGECPRGAGFWCQNKDGRHPNLSREEFEEFAAAAADLLGAVPSLDTPEELEAAVCDTGDQLLRHLATLALNLAAETLDRETPLEGEAYGTVGEAFDAAVALAETGSRTDRNRVKDVLERINENRNHDACDDDGEDDDDTDDGEDDGEDDAPSDGQITICHVPPGNPSKRHTITIGAAAWPAHRAHGDTMGACP